MNKRNAFVIILIILISFPAFCSGPSSFKYSIGFDNPFIGILQRDSKGDIIGNIEAGFGASLGLGIAYKRYFSELKFNYDFDPLNTDRLSPYWSVGTFVLILPYVGVGVDYAWTNGFYGGIGLIASSAIRYVDSGYVGYIGPEVHGGLMF